MFLVVFFFSSRRRHTRCALVTGVQTCALPIWAVAPARQRQSDLPVIGLGADPQFEIAAAVGNHQLARHEHPEPLHEPGQFRKCGDRERRADGTRSEEHTSELQSLMRISYAVFCLKKKTLIDK